MRAMFKRPLTDTWLDLEAEAHSIDVTQVLNGPADITVTLPISYLNMKGPDGHRVIGEYETLVIVEDDAGELSVALIDSIDVQKDTITVSGGGLTVLAKGMPWLYPKKEYVEADAITVFREIWDYILDDERAEVGIYCAGDKTAGGTVGIAPSAEYKKVSAKSADLKRALEVAENRVQSFERGVKIATEKLFKAAGLYTVGQIKLAKSAPSTTKNVIWVETDNYNKAYVYSKGQWVVKTTLAPLVANYLANVKLRDEAKVARTKAKEAYKPYEEKLRELDEQKGEAYTLSWWTTHDLSQVLSELTAAGPFEYVEKAQWNGDDLDLQIVLGAPKIGSRRQELVFELGMNVTQYPTFAAEDPYTDLLMLGAGEGSATLNAMRTFRTTHRVRRMSVQTDKDARTKLQVMLSAKRAADKIGPGNRLSFDTLVVADHKWARPSQYHVGDEIYVSGKLLDGSDFTQWVRITQKSFSSKTTDVTLKVEAVR